MTILSNFLQTDFISLSSCLFLLVALFLSKLYWDGVLMKIWDWLKTLARANSSNKLHHQHDLKTKLFKDLNNSHLEFQKEFFSSIQSNKPLIDENYELVIEDESK